MFVVEFVFASVVLIYVIAYDVFDVVVVFLVVFCYVVACVWMDKWLVVVAAVAVVVVFAFVCVICHDVFLFVIVVVFFVLIMIREC